MTVPVTAPRTAPLTAGHRHPAEFEPLQTALAMYFRALCGQGCELIAYADDADVWQHPDTTSTIRLPAHAPAGEPAQWYQVAVTHRAMHHSLGTFRLDLNRPEPLFPRLRPAAADQPPAPALERFFRLFGRTALAVEVFTVLEDLRVDAAATRMYRGLAPAYRRVQRAALAGRPDLAGLPPRSAVAEALVRISLGAATVSAPDALREPLARVAAAATRLADPAATVESAAEATIRVYATLAALPNVGGSRAARPMDVAGLARDAPCDEPAGDWYGPDVRHEGDEVLDVRLVPVRYRDVPGPRYLGAVASGLPLQEAILRFTDAGSPGSPAAGPPASPGSPDAGSSGAASHAAASDGLTELSLAAERGELTAAGRPEAPPEPLPHDHGPDLDDDHELAHGRLRPRGRGEHVYPEWDSVAGHYLPGWCLVRQQAPKPARTDRLRRRALARHGHLLPGIVAELERVRPVGRDLVTRQRSGHDLDLDACVDAMIDLRTGVQPSERLFTAVRERRRDVAVAFAIDLSSSTAERLPPGPGEPSAVSRIIDLQRDAVTLLAEALDAVGDSYGIYGFSGTGRGDVRLSVIKDLDERRSPAVTHRMAGLTPDHMTRMGPAVRHLTARLGRSEAATRVLLVISDGRPYDLDYGHQHGEEAVLEYAVADTAMAMAEARMAGIRPYLITIDPAGGDYLGRMFDPREYHVISDARDLPKALAELYLVARADYGRSVPGLAGRRHAAAARPADVH